MITSSNAVLTSRGRYVLQLRDESARAWPGSYGLFGGGIEAGESSYSALLREIREELELDLAGRARHLGDFGPCRVFFAEVTDLWPRHCLHEGQAARLFDFDELWALPLNPVTAAAIGAHHQMKTRASA